MSHAKPGEGPGATVDPVELAALLSPYRGRRGAALPALEAVQARYGYVPYPALAVAAETLGILPAELFGVASFYEEFRFSPPGAHTIAVCTGTSCHLAGAPQTLAALAAELKIKPGETTPDGQFTLTEVSCPGPCAIGPAVLVDKQPRGRVTPESVVQLLAALRDKQG